MALQRRGLIWSSGALLVGGGAGAQGAYPDREVRIVLPFGTGGAPQFLARLLAQGLTRTLGQPFLVQNRAGDGGMVGTCVAGVSRPDGHTLLLTTNFVQALASNLQPCVFNVAAGFAPISHLASTSLFLCVPAESRFLSAADVVAALSADQASAVFAALDTTTLDDDAKDAITSAVQNAPEEVRTAFETEIDLFSSGFDDYTQIGSNVPVGTRRALVATMAVSAIAGSGGAARRATRREKK
jgi:tripartite-type tricarboxylate transporter receptor subunit TctC